MELIGQRIRHLRIEERLGQGGMGEVYLARDQVLDRLVAVKTLRAEQRFSEEGKARFLREARLLSKLGDPGICQIYEIVETPDADYLVLEYVRGRTLRAAEPDLELDAKLRLLAKVARALAFAHRAGIVHRDLKADNVMVTPEGEIKILDFGVARSLEDPPSPPDDAESGAPAAAEEPAGAAPSAASPAIDLTELLARPVALGEGPPPDPTSVFVWPEPSRAAASGSAPLTQQGAVVGTLAAMSPEQAAGAAITEASDMYSFGILLQELLTGRGAYGELRGMAVWQKVLRGETVPVQGFDPDLLELLRQLLSVDPLQRPGAELVAARLGWIAEKPERLRRLRRRRRLVGAAFAALAIGLVFTLYLALAARQARDQAERRRQVAEDLIGFMLGDLSDKLQGVGRLEILDAVGERALAYFEALPEGELTADELGWRLQGMQQIADVHLDKGDPHRARQVLERAAGMAARDAARFAGELSIAVAAFDILSTEGQVAFDLGDLAEAERLWKESLDRAEAMQRSWPESAQTRLVKATALHNLGSVLDRQGRRAEAIVQLRQAIEVEDTLVAGGEKIAESRGLRSASRGFLSRALERQGDLEGALAVRRQYLADLETEAAAAPEDAAIQFDLAVARGFVAGLELVRGELAAAEEGYRRGQEGMARLAAADPQNVEVAIWVARFLATPSELRMALGKSDEALAALDAAQLILDPLAAGQPDLPDLLAARGIVQLRRGLLLEPTAPERALVAAGQAAGLLEKLLPRADDGQRIQLANAFLLRARLLAARGRGGEAQRAVGAAEEMLAPLKRPLVSTYALETTLEILIHRGALEEAESTFARLDAMGWKAPRRQQLERMLSELRAKPWPGPARTSAG